VARISEEQYRRLVAQAEARGCRAQPDPGPAKQQRERARPGTESVLRPGVGTGRAHKYGAVPVALPGGERFDSTGEYRRWQELCRLEAAGAIRDLTRDRRRLTFPLVVGSVTVCAYVADFSYVEADTGAAVIEDFKGVRTPAYRIKARLMQAVHGITIRETGGGRRAAKKTPPKTRGRRC
jgi:hypothetical protein